MHGLSALLLSCLACYTRNAKNGCDGRCEFMVHHQTVKWISDVYEYLLGVIQF